MRQRTVWARLDPLPWQSLRQNLGELIDRDVNRTAKVSLPSTYCNCSTVIGKFWRFPIQD